MRAERRVGEMLAEMQKAKGGYVERAGYFGRSQVGTARRQGAVSVECKFYLMPSEKMKYLAAAIVFAVIVLAVMFRYEYQDRGSFRVNRWTGTVETICMSRGEYVWLSEAECRQASLDDEVDRVRALIKK
ncbi:hypothetical protein RA280_15925 [Cupriavidus sp. CV2]|uniref:hypothetical protein n=1 Tax=Cupriavidus ulmosensis TaxID=3065913 RepID=UPI00296B1748|nr:hypothetical protein [Cupriavidus sp. CV2]MDW3683213.1 hypothetical protein [Cupriavidus sp. CV2]